MLGELLITGGAFVLLFLVWQLWFNDLVVGNQLHGESLEQSQTWERDASTAAHGTPQEPAGARGAAANATFGLMIVPRFGADYYRPIAEGTGTVAVLNKGEIGHYPSTQMPGAVGNFAVAAHRTSYGKPFNQISSLSVGDQHLHRDGRRLVRLRLPEPRVRAADRRRRHRAGPAGRRRDRDRPAPDHDQLQPAVLVS